MSQHVVVWDTENNQVFSLVEVHSEDDRELIMETCKEAIDEGWCAISDRINDCIMRQFLDEWKEGQDG